MKSAHVRLYSNDEATLLNANDLAEMSAEDARLKCVNTTCELTCTVNREARKVSSEKIVATYACQKAIDTPVCINTIRLAAELLDGTFDSLEKVDASFAMYPLRDGEDPSWTYIDLRWQN